MRESAGRMVSVRLNDGGAFLFHQMLTQGVKGYRETLSIKVPGAYAFDEV